MQRAGVLHRDERVAFQHEAGHAHQHREDVVIERLGRVGKEAAPDVGAGAKPERARDVEPRRSDRLNEPAAIEALYAVRKTLVSPVGVVVSWPRSWT